MDLVHLWKVFSRRWWLVLAMVFVAAVGSLVISRRTTPLYQSSTRLLVNAAQSPGTTSYDNLLTNENLAATYIELLHGAPILQSVVSMLRLPFTPNTLDQNTNAQVLRNTSIIEISVQDTDRLRAPRIADQLGRALTKSVQDLQAATVQAVASQTQQQLTAVGRTIANLSTQLDSLRHVVHVSANTTAAVEDVQNGLSQYRARYQQLLSTQQQMAVAQVQAAFALTTVAPASVPTAPAQPTTKRNLVLAVVGGALLGLLVALLVDFLDDRVRSPDDVHRLADVALLAVVDFLHVKRSPLLVGTTAFSEPQFTAALLLLRASLDHALGNGSRVICLSSATAHEGKSTLAANLALLEAQEGRRVILIDANFRNPQLHRFFGVANDEGLSSFLKQMPAGAMPLFQTGPFSIKVLPSGPLSSDAGILLGSRRFADLLDRLRAHADTIIIDSAPILSAADTLLLQRAVDGTILVVDMQRTGLKVLVSAVSSLRQASGTLLGVVLNKNRQRNKFYFATRPEAVQGHLQVGIEP